jgi:hypothetical protein
MNDGHGTERGRRPLAGIRAVQTIAQRRPPTPINPNVEFLEIPIPNGLVTAADNQVKVQLSGVSGDRVVVVVAPALRP